MIRFVFSCILSVLYSFIFPPPPLFSVFSSSVLISLLLIVYLFVSLVQVTAHVCFLTGILRCHTKVINIEP